MAIIKENALSSDASSGTIGHSLNFGSFFSFKRGENATFFKTGARGTWPWLRTRSLWCTYGWCNPSYHLPPPPRCHTWFHCRKKVETKKDVKFGGSDRWSKCDSIKHFNVKITFLRGTGHFILLMQLISKTNGDWKLTICHRSINHIDRKRVSAWSAQKGRTEGTLEIPHH